MNWLQVRDFIVQKDPAASLVGVAQAQIEAVQREFGIALPSDYVEFLRTMGEESAGLQVFGETQIHSFSKLLRQLPPDGYPPERFFKVAYEAGRNAVAYLHTFLDLSRSDGSDAALVALETPLDPDETDFPEEALSFSETVTYRIFWLLDMAKREYNARVVAFGEEGWDASIPKLAATRILAESGFTLALPELPRVAALTGTSASALINIDDIVELVAIDIGGDSREALEALTERLVAGVPGAELRRAPTERTGEA